MMEEATPLGIARVMIVPISCELCQPRMASKTGMGLKKTRPSNRLQRSTKREISNAILTRRCSATTISRKVEAVGLMSAMLLYIVVSKCLLIYSNYILLALFHQVASVLS